MYNYKGDADWTRFKLYASFIQAFNFATGSLQEMSPHHATELFTLAGIPSPLFPNLQRVSICPLGVSSVASLFLLMTPSLRTFERLSCPFLGSQNGNEVPPPAGPHQPSVDLMAVLPRMAASYFHLKTFIYSGPTNDEFFFRLSHIKPLKVLRLRSTSLQGVAAIQNIRRLAFLEDFDFEVLDLTLDASLKRSPVLFDPTVLRLGNLQSLSITSSGYAQALLGWTIYPTKLRRLNLRFFGETVLKSIEQCGWLFLQPNPQLEALFIDFFFQDIPPMHAFIIRTDEAQAQTPLLEYLNGLKSIGQFSVTGIPCRLATDVSPQISQAMYLWRRVKEVTFRVQPEAQVTPAGASAGSNPSPFPGPSFLSSTVRDCCPNLEKLEFHFDKALITDESLEAVLESREIPQIRHPLRELKINVGDTIAAGAELNLPASRKADIAMFLDRLFPQLEVVDGSASAVWREVGVLVKAFRRQREHFVAQVEGVLTGC